MLICVLLAPWGAGCESTANPTHALTTPNTPARRTLKIERPDLPPPSAVVEAAAVARRSGDALDRAGWTYDQVLASLAVPEFLIPFETEDADPDAEADTAPPPTVAVRNYGKARDRYRYGQLAEARQLLEEALRLDPQSYEVQRLLGKVYLDMRQNAKGALYLRQAVRIRPDDAWSVFQLGRFAHSQRRWEEAIVALDRALRLEDSELDVVATYLGHYFIGQSLLALGYDTAGMEQLKRFLEIPARPARTTRMGREMSFLLRQRGPAWAQIGDAWCRLGQYGAAEQYYALAVDAPMVNRTAVRARQVYLLLTVGDDEAAIDLANDELTEEDYTRDALTLARYVATHTGQPQRIVKRVRKLYEESSRSTRLVLALVALLDDADATNLLIEHVSARPDDQVAWKELMQRLLPDRLDEAVDVTLSLIRERPEDAAELAKALIRQSDDRRTLRAVLADATDHTDGPAAPYLYGEALKGGRKFDAAADAYQRAIERDPGFVPAQLGLVEVLLRNGDHEAAQQRLDAMTDLDDPRVRRFRVQIYQRLERYDEALALLELLLQEDSGDVDLRLRQAHIQIAQSKLYEAELTLLSILDMAPSSETAYEMLFVLYDARQDRTKTTTLMRRLQSSIPQSRIARLKRAEIFIAKRQYVQAQSLLEPLVAENSDDVIAFTRLAEVLVRVRAWDRLGQLFMQRVAADPSDPQIVNIILTLHLDAVQASQSEPYYQFAQRILEAATPSFTVFITQGSLLEAAGRTQEAIAAFRRALDEAGEDDVVPVAEELIRLYLLTERSEEALALLDEMRQQRPEHGATWWVRKSAVYTELGQDDLAEEMLLEALALDPDDPQVNNNLGYSWADAGRHLERANTMIDKALAVHPDEPAYLDSKGWVLYKLGRYAEAVQWLNRARAEPMGRTDPLILDHLGDAMWRDGRRNDAMQHWRLSVQFAGASAEQQGGDVPEYYAAVMEAARSKLAAAAADEPPPLAPVGEMDDVDHVEEPGDVPAEHHEAPVAP